jgi:hypothetical protein
VLPKCIVIATSILGCRLNVNGSEVIEVPASIITSLLPPNVRLMFVDWLIRLPPAEAAI